LKRVAMEAWIYSDFIIKRYHFLGPIVEVILMMHMPWITPYDMQMFSQSNKKAWYSHFQGNLNMFGI
jgi:hypothetical protein